MRVRAERIEELVHKLDSIGDPEVRSVARELVQSVTELHVKGLERVLEILSESGTPFDSVIDRIGDDDLVGPLMALHDLHPLSLSDRVVRGMEKAEDILKKQGATAELLSVRDGNVRIRLRASAHGCESSAASPLVELENAIYQAAPDLNTLSIEEETITPTGFVPLEALTAIPAGPGL